MSESRFLLYRGFGNKQNILTWVKNYVQQHNLGVDIPLVKFEPGRSREFYVGLAIQTHGNNKILETPKIMQLNKSIGMQHFPNTKSTDGLFGAEEINKFLSGNVDWEGFNAKLKFEIQKAFYDPSIVGENIFNKSIEQEGSSPESEKRFKQLFLYLSSRNQGTYREFVRVVKTIFGNDYDKSWPIMRRLILLGHIEIDTMKNKNWSIVPFSLTQIETDKNVFYVTGQFLPPHINKLQGYASIELSHKQNNYAPDTIYVKCKEEGALEEVTGELGLECRKNAGYMLLELLPPTENMEKYLYMNDHFNLLEYEVYSFDNEVLDSTKLGDGAYIVKHESTPLNKETTLKNGDNWYFGPYYDILFFDKIKNKKELPSCIYFADEERLIIPDLVRPPFLFEKSLVQCSGTIPQVNNTGGAKYLQYTHISQRIAELFSSKTTMKIEWR